VLSMLLLDPYRILDLTGPLGFSCGKILGDLGADVVKVEAPGGDPARRTPPLLGVPDDAGQSLYWLAFNANKRSITLDINLPGGRDLFVRLAKRADFILESSSPGELDRRDIGYDRLKKENPGVIWVSITPFGQQGPYENFQASDLEIMALGGAMSLAGEKDGEPMRVTVPQAPMWVGAEAAMGALTALAHRGLTGKGQRVDVSAQVAVMAALAHAPAFWDLNRVNPQRDGIYMTGRSVTGARMKVFWTCQDGWINFILYGGAAGCHANQQLVAWMKEKGMAPEWLQQVDWSQFDIKKVTQKEVDKFEGPIGRFFSTLTKRQFFEGAFQREILGYPVSTVEDLCRDPQLGARQFWQDVQDPTSGVTLRYPGGFALFNGERPAIRCPPPCVGQHNREVYEELLGLTAAEIEEFRAAGVV
jgi:crotonobetainyl-CoA:carnitine CoA-transferase CaiB-like acyl-CoA transferase